MTTAAQKVIEALYRTGAVTAIHLVPGSSLNPLLDALSKQNTVKMYVSTTEGAAVQKSLALAMYGAQKVGVTAVSAGSGLAEASKALWEAYENKVPFVLLVGQSPIEKIGTVGAFQSVNAKKVSGYAKKVVCLQKSSHVAEVIRDAVAVAQEGVPGAVVVEAPIDVLRWLSEESSVRAESRHTITPAKADMQKLLQVGKSIAESGQKPLMILGDIFRAEAIATSDLRPALHELCAENGLAVATTHGATGCWPTDCELYAGSLGYNLIASQVEIFHQFDYPILLGAAPDDNLTIRSVGNDWTNKPFTMIYPDKAVLDEYQQRYPQALTICSDMMPAVAFLNALQYGIDPTARRRHVKRLHAQMLANMETSRFESGSDLREAAKAITLATRHQRVVQVFDAGDAPADVAQRLRYKGTNDHIATPSAHVGFALPAGIGIAQALQSHGQGPIVLIHTGDGGMNYCAPELAIAAECKLPIVCLVYNDGRFGAVRRSNLRCGYLSAAEKASHLPQVDFAKVAQAYGAQGVRGKMEHLAEQVSAALADARRGGGPTVIDIGFNVQYNPSPVRELKHVQSDLSARMGRSFEELCLKSLVH